MDGSRIRLLFLIELYVGDLPPASKVVQKCHGQTACDQQVRQRLSLHKGHLSMPVNPARNKLDCVGKMAWMISSSNIMSFASFKIQIGSK